MGYALEMMMAKLGNTTIHQAVENGTIDFQDWLDVIDSEREIVDNAVTIQNLDRNKLWLTPDSPRWQILQLLDKEVLSEEAILERIGNNKHHREILSNLINESYIEGDEILLLSTRGEREVRFLKAQYKPDLTRATKKTKRTKAPKMDISQVPAVDHNPIPAMDHHPIPAMDYHEQPYFIPQSTPMYPN
jgi:hypothetical protein